jgi:hypothetical protein
VPEGDSTEPPAAYFKISLSCLIKAGSSLKNAFTSFSISSPSRFATTFLFSGRKVESVQNVHQPHLFPPGLSTFIRTSSFRRCIPPATAAKLRAPAMTRARHESGLAITQIALKRASFGRLARQITS